jgi:hypothetical protein
MNDFADLVIMYSYEVLQTGICSNCERWPFARLCSPLFITVIDVYVCCKPKVPVITRQGLSQVADFGMTWWCLR